MRAGFPNWDCSEILSATRDRYFLLGYMVGLCFLGPANLCAISASLSNALELMISPGPKQSGLLTLKDLPLPSVGSRAPHNHSLLALAIWSNCLPGRGLARRHIL